MLDETQNAWKEHWDAYAAAFSQPLQDNGLVSRFVRNPNVTGAYAEAWVRSIARNMLAHRYRISTGAVVRTNDTMRGLKTIPQCDLIVWDPSELPGLFECGEFALIPLAASRGIIEIKRTLNSEAEFSKQLQQRCRLTVPRGRLLGVVVNHPSPLFDLECAPDWLARAGGIPHQTRLLDNHGQPDTNGILAFIYFLAQLVGHDRTVLR